MSKISLSELEDYLWNSAVLLRTNIDAGAYKQYIFPLLFFKRVCDVYDEEIENAIEKYGWDNFEHEIVRTGMTNEESSKKYFHSIWSQVAERFKKYDSRLIFESINEPLYNDVWSPVITSDKYIKAIEILEYFNQDLVIEVNNKMQDLNKILGNNLIILHINNQII